MVLSFGLSRELLIFVEEPVGGSEDLALVNTPGLTKSVHDILIGIQGVYCLLEGNVVKSHDTI